MSKIKTKAEAIMTNVPESFFRENRISHDSFIRYYLSKSDSDDPIFYHFISTVPVQSVVDVFICFGGRVQLKCKVVEFLKNQPLELPHYSHPQPRNWMITGGPVSTPPREVLQKGFRGFRYTDLLW